MISTSESVTPGELVITRTFGTPGELISTSESVTKGELVITGTFDTPGVKISTSESVTKGELVITGTFDTPGVKISTSESVTKGELVITGTFDTPGVKISTSESVTKGELVITGTFDTPGVKISTSESATKGELVITGTFDTPGVKISTTCKSENVTADIFFVLDASDWVSEIDFEYMLEFVKSFVDSFIYGPDNVRVGIKTYSGGLTMNIHFTHLPTKEMLYYAMNFIQYDGGDARLHAGLVSAHIVFSEPYGDRETAPNFLIVISGGKSSEPHKTKAILAPLAREGALNSIKAELVGHICREIKRATGNTQQGARDDGKSDDVTADVFFLLDASDWLSGAEFKHTLDFVKSFVDSFIYGPDNVRVGIYP
ncbi:hypothetical protein RRG08_052833 [Elysia crispata]|uniref:VWFA domain-containing protein n=1 Tax=Elysia crispata TaxID=231223 RepID=A0AAE1A5Y6_9GAST|nr:hypothetical protein RRG08_052833 [Elysia crispata]